MLVCRHSIRRKFYSIGKTLLLALLLQGLILPPSLVYAKGGSSTRGSESNQVTFGNNVQAGGRIFYLDARQEAPPVLPNLKRVSDCETSSPFPSLSPSFLSFDGERSYEVGSLWNLNECGEVVPSLGLIQLSQMNLQAGDVLVVTHEDENGEIYEEEVDASRASLVWAGMKAEMAFIFGEGAGEFFLEVLGAALIGAGIVALASLHAILGVVLTVVALLVGVYLIGEYADRWMAGEYEEIGRHLVRDVIYLLAAYGGGRSVPILKRGVMALLRRMPKAKAFFGAMDQMARSSTQIRQQIDDALGEAEIKGQIDDVLGEAWTKVHRNPPGSGGSRLRPIPNGGGVATLSRPRVLPKTELVRKSTAPAWKLNPAEVVNVRISAQAPGTYAELVPGTTAVNAAADATVPGTILEYGYAEGVGQHNVDRYSAYHLERQGLKTLGSKAKGSLASTSAGGSEEFPTRASWRYSQADDDEFLLSDGTYVVSWSGKYYQLLDIISGEEDLEIFDENLIVQIPHPDDGYPREVRITTGIRAFTADADTGEFELIFDEGHRRALPPGTQAMVLKILEKTEHVVLWVDLGADRHGLYWIEGRLARKLKTVLKAMEGTAPKSTALVVVNQEELRPVQALLKDFIEDLQDQLDSLEERYSQLPFSIRVMFQEEDFTEPAEASGETFEILAEGSKDPKKFARAIKDLQIAFQYDREDFSRLDKLYEDDLHEYRDLLMGIEQAYTSILNIFEDLFSQLLDLGEEVEAKTVNSSESEFSVDELIAEITSNGVVPDGRIIITSPEKLLSQAQYLWLLTNDAEQIKQHCRDMEGEMEIALSLYNEYISVFTQLLEREEIAVFEEAVAAIAGMDQRDNTATLSAERARALNTREDLEKILQVLFDDKRLRSFQPISESAETQILEARDDFATALSDLIEVMRRPMRHYPTPIPPEEIPHTLEIARTNLDILIAKLDLLPLEMREENKVLLDTKLRELLEMLSNKSFQDLAEKNRRDLAFFVEGFDRTGDEILKVFSVMEDPELQEFYAAIQRLNRNLRGFLHPSTRP